MPGQTTQVLIVSDIHYAGEKEQERQQYELKAVGQPLLRLLTKAYRHYYWMRDPFAHNHLVDKVLEHPGEVDLVIANGDFSCDSAFVGVSDDAACASAQHCLGLLTQRFGSKFRAVVGDHELGKTSLFGGRGGMRLRSWERLTEELKMEPFWEARAGRYQLIGITSTLIALPTYRCETLPDEYPRWEALRKEQFDKIRSLFQELPPDRKVILFAHDPTALPYLARDPAIQSRLGQVEKTIIGHLHSESVLWRSRSLAGMPHIQFLGNAINRMSAALNEARLWQPFNILLCPALAGIEWRKDGGYYIMELSERTEEPAKFTFHPVPRNSATPA